nr:hypothetical protein [Tanacetum cinerariifolium]
SAVKELFSFRCVSKQWGKYIEDRHLAIIHGEREHTERPIDVATPILFHEIHPTCSKQTLITFCFHIIDEPKQDGSANHVLKPKKYPDFNFLYKKTLSKENVTRVQLLGYCNGLIYILQDDHQVINSLVAIHPMKKQRYELPAFPLPFDGFMFRESCGLGFDSSTDTFKMVCVFLKAKSPPKKPHLVRENLCTMVHVFGTNSWQEIPQVPCCPISEKAVFANGYSNKDQDILIKVSRSTITPTCGASDVFFVYSLKSGVLQEVKIIGRDTQCRATTDIIMHFRINISQLSVIEAAKVSHFEILCRVFGIAPMTGGFSARVYGTLAAHPSPFQKFLEEFMYMVRLSRHYTLNEETYPRPDLTKVKIVKWEQVEYEPLLLQTIVGRTVPLLPVVLDRSDSEMETSIDKLFDEGGSGREDYGTLSGPSVAGKSSFAVQRLFVGAVLNAEVRGEPIPTLPFVTSSVYTTPKLEDRDHTDSVIEPNLQTTSAPSFVPVMTAVTTTTSMAGPDVVVKEKTGKPSLFALDSSFTIEDILVLVFIGSYRK